MMSLLTVAALVGVAVALLVGPAPATFVRPRELVADAPGVTAESWLLRWRPCWCLLAALASVVVVGGWLGWVGAPGAAVACWVVIGRAESPTAARERADVRADLPILVRLLAAALAAGSAPEDALAAAVEALPGAAASRIAPVLARLRLGMDPADAWRALADVPGVAGLGRTLARAQATGTPVAAMVERLGEELAREARAAAEDRARRVGVKAAVPLGLCLLPAFLLIGIVPLVGGLLSTIFASG